MVSCEIQVWKSKSWTQQPPCVTPTCSNLPMRALIFLLSCSVHVAGLGHLNSWNSQYLRDHIRRKRTSSSRFWILGAGRLIGSMVRLFLPQPVNFGWVELMCNCHSGLSLGPAIMATPRSLGTWSSKLPSHPHACVCNRSNWSSVWGGWAAGG